MGAAAVLNILRNGELLKSVPVHGEVSLGRSEGCVIRLEDRAVSRNHAAFKNVEGVGIQVEKKSDFAPLIVNGAECSQALLKLGDVVSIGPYLIQVSQNGDREFLAKHDRRPPVSLAPVESELEPIAAHLSPIAPIVNDEAEAARIGEVSLSSAVDAPFAPPADTVEEENDASPSESASADAAENGFALSAIPTADSPSAESELSLGSLSSPSIGNLTLQGVNPEPPPTDTNGMGLSPVAEPAAEAAEESPKLSFGSGGSGLLAPPPSFDVTSQVESADADAATKAVSPERIQAKLTFKEGTANVTELDFEKDVVTIGRGKNCDVVLEDKRASRKNTEIRREGLHFTIEDLDSSNGTYVNGEKISGKQKLTGDDQIKVGDTEFQFKVLNLEYVAREKNFMSVPESGTTSSFGETSGPIQEMPSIESLMGTGAGQARGAGGQYSSAAPAASSSFSPAVASGTPFKLNASSTGQTSSAILGIPGIPGVGASGKNQSKSLFGKFKNLPREKRLIVLVAIIGALYLWEDEAPKTTPDKNAKPKAGQKVEAKASPKPGASGKPSASFANLTAEQQRNIETWHDLAFDHYKNQEFDKAIFEISKIFQIIPDYKDSRDIERYAKEGKRKLEQIQEEQRKKEEEARLRARIGQLLEEARQRMVEKHYEQARELFAQILTLEPDNASVALWNKQIEAEFEKQKLDQQQKAVLAEVNRAAAERLGSGIALQKQEKHQAAIRVFETIFKITEDRKMHAVARAKIKASREAIAAKRDPFLKEGQEAEQANDYVKAYQAYENALTADPGSNDAKNGIGRIRGVLHDRAKGVYTEAVLAESYSDFALAKRKFQECLDTAPKGDLYRERAQRKLARYFTKEEAPQ